MPSDLPIVVTHGDLTQAYEVISPIFVYTSNKGIFNRQFDELELKYRDKILEWQKMRILPDVFGEIEEKNKNKSRWSWKGWRGEGREVRELLKDTQEAQIKRALYMALEEIREEARVLEANAVIFLKNQFHFDNGSEFRLLSEGTAVRLI
ncbi:MAG: hypothetical protein NW226_13655 [Microscillaceae bacterium]|nr:hypothetical protein [Microscillaceae bacterium]